MIPEEFTAPVELDTDAALELLREGELEIEGRVMPASNATFYCSLHRADLRAAAVYKPVSGERPLWDFPDGTLAEREVAAYELSAATGWNLVPPTVLRDGPAGPGMAQLWIEEDEDADIVALINGGRSAELRRMAVFDAVINNADRKGGHLLPTRSGHVYGVDHGISFHREDKLRTVLWHWAGQELPADARAMLTALRAALDADLGTRLEELLTVAEVRKTRRRVERLLGSGRHPEPSGDWPAVPWPPM